MSEHYTESQVNQIEQDAHDGAILEAGKEWERQCDEFNSREYELESRIAELEAENIRLGIEYQRMRLALGDIAINSKRVLKESPNDTQTQTIVYGKESE